MTVAIILRDVIRRLCRGDEESAANWTRSIERRGIFAGPRELAATGRGSTFTADLPRCDLSDILT